MTKLISNLVQKKNKKKVKKILINLLMVKNTTLMRTLLGIQISQVIMVLVRFTSIKTKDPLNLVNAKNVTKTTTAKVEVVRVQPKVVGGVQTKEITNLTTITGMTSMSVTVVDAMSVAVVAAMSVTAVGAMSVTVVASLIIVAAAIVVAVIALVSLAMVAAVTKITGVATKGITVDLVAINVAALAFYLSGMSKHTENK